MDKSKISEISVIFILTILISFFVLPLIFFILRQSEFIIAYFLSAIVAFILIIGYTQASKKFDTIGCNSIKSILKIYLLISFILSVLFISSFLTILIVETNYHETYRQFEDDYTVMRNVGYSDIDAIYNATRQYLDKENYYSTWTIDNATIPRRVITGNQLSFLLNPLTSVYLFYFDGLDKFTAYSKTGNCEEKAVSLSILINDVTKYPTRQISMVGFDHGFTEAKIGEEWYVYDTGFTTYEYPVIAKNYSAYLDSNAITSVSQNLVDLLCVDSGKSCMEDHGFEVTKLRINFVDRFNKPVENPSIEIYGVRENGGNQLLKTGEAENSNYSCNLRRGMEYCLVAKRNGGGKEQAILKIFEADKSEVEFSTVI